MTTKRALVTGITGQDGSYLAEPLLGKGYEVHGLIRRSSTFSTSRIEHLCHDPHESGTRLSLHYGDLTDPSSLLSAVHLSRPDEIYNLGAQSHVKVSVGGAHLRRRPGGVPLGPRGDAGPRSVRLRP